MKLLTLRMAAMASLTGVVSAKLVLLTATAHVVAEIDDDRVVVVNTRGVPLYTYLANETTKIYTASIEEPTTALKGHPISKAKTFITHTSAPHSSVTLVAPTTIRPTVTSRKPTMSSEPGTVYTFMGTFAAPTTVPPPQSPFSNTSAPSGSGSGFPSQQSPAASGPVTPPQNSVESGPDGATIYSCVSGSEHAQCQAALSDHNGYRSKHSAPSMTWDSNIAAIAAASLMATPCVMQDYIDLGDVNSGHQSNAAAGYTDLSAATDAWYSEIDVFTAIGGFGDSSQAVTAALTAYNNQHGTDIEVGHFVNLIFKAHIGLGCAWATCPNGVDIGDAVAQGATTNLLCLYSPYGIYYDSWPSNLSED